MKNAIRKMMIVLAGVSIIFAAAGNAAAGDVVNVGGVQISAADYMDIKARVAGEPSGDRVYAKKAEAVNVGQVQMARSEYESVKAIVAGNASVADAVVYAQAPEMVNVGPVAVDRAEFEAVKNMVGGGPVVRLAQHIHSAHALN
ncbi:MAG: hypothetical protein JEZ11_06085 [Desulfobacterales bacterium]|nr:hypothetical protein [Desulfobacterales bacterium]